MEILKQTHGESINENHLGGWSIGGDGGTYYPVMWQYLVEKYDIKSVLDVGCGRGYSTRFFKSLGCDVRGVDGSETAKELTLLEPDEFIYHDYTKGNLDILKKFDLCWSCEFVEHVEEQFAINFINSFKQCRYIAMTFAGIGQGGHHHVNENTQEYWINLLQDNNFTYLEQATTELRNKTIKDKEIRLKETDLFFIPHFIDRGLFFINNDYR